MPEPRAGRRGSGARERGLLRLHHCARHLCPQAVDVPTIATAALLLAGAGLSEAEVGGIARFVFQEGRGLAVRGSAQGTQISAANAELGLSVPLHHAAAEAIAAINGK